MALVFICKRRSDIPDGVLQVPDLRPNESQRNLIYEPPGQTRYINRPQNDDVQTQGAGPITTTLSFSGVAAYLIDHIEAGGLAAGTGALTATDANDAADAILAIMDAGGALTLAAVNAAIAGVVADTELTNGGGSASTGSLVELLRILSGDEYILPAGSQVEDGANAFDPTVSGSFTRTEGQFRATVAGWSTDTSLLNGALAGFTSATFSYKGVTGAALVVYDEAGAVLS